MYSRPELVSPNCVALIIKSHLRLGKKSKCLTEILTFPTPDSEPERREGGGGRQLLLGARGGGGGGRGGLHCLPPWRTGACSLLVSSNCFLLVWLLQVPEGLSLHILHFLVNNLMWESEAFRKMEQCGIMSPSLIGGARIVKTTSNN